MFKLVLDISYQQLGEMCQMEGLCAPWNHGMYNVHFVIYIFVLDICCQHLGNICQSEGFCAPFGRKVKECTFWILDICCQHLENICQYVCIVRVYNKRQRGMAEVKRYTLCTTQL